jgi:hypothetical protein
MGNSAIHTRTFIAGINGVTVMAGSTVGIDYKQEVQDGERPLQYGLIAEEVAEIFPDLVVYDEEGKPFTVKYQLLSSMLLNELQRYVQQDEAQTRQLDEQVQAQARELDALRTRLAALESPAAPEPPAGVPADSR